MVNWLRVVLGLCGHPEGTIRRRRADGSYEFLCELCWQSWKVEAVKR
jgi:hypothetical protein